MASKAAYGSNVNAGRNVNADNGWGSHKWPAGVPSSLLGQFSYQQVNGAKQLIRGTVRKELVELFRLAAAIADVKYGYQIWASKNGEVWGPWTYENRAISGTSSASNHSRGRAWDVNAPNNPYTAEFISDMPPGMVNDWERMGLSWGGRYQGRTDTMHFEYAWTPADVAGHLQIGTNILRGVPSTNKPAGSEPPAPTKDWFDMADEAALRRIVREELDASERDNRNNLIAVLRSPEFKSAAPLKVVRHDETQVDYAYGPGYFKFIESPDDYHFLSSTGLINTPHGEAQPVARNLLNYIRDRAAESASNPAAIDAIVEPTPKA